jgi:hypothetical protein
MSNSTLVSELVTLVSMPWLTERYVREFEFVPGETWLSSNWVFLVVPGYLGMLQLLKAHVARRGKPYELKEVSSPSLFPLPNFEMPPLG